MSQDERSFMSKICLGEGPLWLSCLTWPLVLAWSAMSIYVLPCLAVIIIRIANLFCHPICSSCWVFEDKQFEGDAAIGKKSTGSHIKWVRAQELATEGQTMRMYEEGIKPSDLVQGAVGDCWLVAALASAAEHPACIRRALVTREANTRGKYCVRLFDGQKDKWVTVTVDDRIPVNAASMEAVYMKKVGNQMWAILIEKAFAKFCGSYEALDRGLTAWAWRAITGDYVFSLKSVAEGAKWEKLEFRNNKKDTKNKRAAGLWRTEEIYTPDQAWVLIQKYIKADSLCAASGGQDMGSGSNNNGGLNGENMDDNGLVGSHAYSILDARELGLIPGLSLSAGLLGKTKLIRLRNPWGQFEWKGAWSVGSKEWKENPLVKMRLRPKDEDDGSFWMPWQDFSRIFKRVDICDRTTKRDLRLNVHEDVGSCGVVAGCVAGIADFVLCCKGLRVIYGGHVSSGETRSARRGCCGLVGGPLGGAPDDGGAVAV